MMTPAPTLARHRQVVGRCLLIFAVHLLCYTQCTLSLRAPTSPPLVSLGEAGLSAGAEAWTFDRALQSSDSFIDWVETFQTHPNASDPVAGVELARDRLRGLRFLAEEDEVQFLGEVQRLNDALVHDVDASGLEPDIFALLERIAFDEKVDLRVFCGTAPTSSEQGADDADAPDFADSSCRCSRFVFSRYRYVPAYAHVASGDPLSDVDESMEGVTLSSIYLPKADYFDDEAAYVASVPPFSATHVRLGYPSIELEGATCPGNSGRTDTKAANTVVVTRVDFSDLSGLVRQDSEVDAIHQSVQDFFASNSRGQTSLSISVVPGLYRLPQTAAYYTSSNTNLFTMLNDAKALASAFDTAWDPCNFDLDFAAFPRKSSLWWAGLAAVGYRSGWLNGPNGYASRIFSHEIGHNYGMRHSMTLRTPITAVEDSSRESSGTFTDYGDYFCTMGSGTGDFNTQWKELVDWISEDNGDIYRIDSSATPRHDIILYPHDVEAAWNRGYVSIHVYGTASATVSSNSEYFLSFRNGGSSMYNCGSTCITALSDGLEVRKKISTSATANYLMDFKRTTTTGKDATLRTDETYEVRDGGIHFVNNGIVACPADASLTCLQVAVVLGSTANVSPSPSGGAVSPSSTPSRSLSVTRSVSQSKSSSISETRTPSTSRSQTRSRSASASFSSSSTRSVSVSRSPSRSVTSSISLSPTNSRDPAMSASRTPTKTKTATVTSSRTPSTSSSRTSSVSVTPSRTVTPSGTPAVSDPCIDGTHNCDSHAQCISGATDDEHSNAMAILLLADAETANDEFEVLSFRCECDGPFWEGNGTHCYDVNECAANTDPTVRIGDRPCPNAMCINRIGQPHQCQPCSNGNVGPDCQFQLRQPTGTQGETSNVTIELFDRNLDEDEIGSTTGVRVNVRLRVNTSSSDFDATRYSFAVSEMQHEHSYLRRSKIGSYGGARFSGLAFSATVFDTDASVVQDDFAVPDGVAVKIPPVVLQDLLDSVQPSERLALFRYDAAKSGWVEADRGCSEQLDTPSALNENTTDIGDTWLVTCNLSGDFAVFAVVDGSDSNSLIVYGSIGAGALVIVAVVTSLFIARRRRNNREHSMRTKQQRMSGYQPSTGGVQACAPTIGTAGQELMHYSHYAKSEMGGVSQAYENYSKPGPPLPPRPNASSPAVTRNPLPPLPSTLPTAPAPSPPYSQLPRNLPPAPGIANTSVPPALPDRRAPPTPLRRPAPPSPSTSSGRPLPPPPASSTMSQQNSVIAPPTPRRPPPPYSASPSAAGNTSGVRNASGVSSFQSPSASSPGSLAVGKFRAAGRVAALVAAFTKDERGSVHER